jgi:queuine tRNA-ribosyltransferase
LREQSAAALVALDLPGYAIGGLSVGESREEMARFARFSADRLPKEKPRYLMGVGTVRDVLAAIDAGVDLFDCVYPTRCGRTGRAIARNAELNLHNARFVRDYTPVDETCPCAVCATYTRAYLAHLFRSNEMLGPRLLSYHNLARLISIVEEAREAIAQKTWTRFLEEFA